MKWEIQTKGRTYIRRKENKQTLERKLKLRIHNLESTEQTENNVGHNKMFKDTTIKVRVRSILGRTTYSNRDANRFEQFNW